MLYEEKEDIEGRFLGCSARVCPCFSVSQFSGQTHLACIIIGNHPQSQLTAAKNALKSPNFFINGWAK
jgi:hypothetical protein